ncbi:hypothetical protein [Natrinema pallidum]|uniref:Uncharacterized protein n=1 Tax=Natrinema pallidum TaxID=69527 RepID=A0A4P9TGQ9_9EURY|nr:hypothetical protein [Natrinema pallidum]QCW04056.1 hypothetical protein FGF80_12780 [Natrinema pallidum]
MEATITGEDDIAVGLSVIDNNGEEHLIEMEMDGEIYHHNQDAYADDPDKRSSEGKKHVGHAARYAKYHVYRERGYDTFDVSENPDRLLQTAIIVGALSREEFEEYFGDLYQQLKSHGTDQDPVVDVMDEVREDAFFVYAKEIYLGLDDSEIAELATSLTDADARAYLQAAASLLDDASAGSPELIEEFADLAAEHGIDPFHGVDEPGQWIRAAPTLYPKWRIGTQLHEDPDQLPDIDGDPDCRLEIVPYDPDSIEALQEYVVQHIKCQIRDCFVGMGIVPPEPFRVQGPGTDFYTMQFQHYDFYQPYHDPDADIDWESV